MIIKLKKNITVDQRDQLLKLLHQQGVELNYQGSHSSGTIKINPNGATLSPEKLEALPAVERVFEADPGYSMVSRQHKPDDTIIRMGDFTIGGGEPVVIAGPCAVEDETQILETARLVKSRDVRVMRGGAFKPRTSPYSFAGLEEKGLKLLRKAAEETGLKIITEVLDTEDVALVAEYTDILQIGSRNMHNYKLLKAVGRIRKPVLLKRGMSATLQEFLGSAEHVMNEGNEQVMLCERGIRTFVEYSRNTLDLNIVPVIKNLSHLPIIVDPSHGTGRSDIVIPMSLAALAAGADGIMVEVHPRPDQSWSDPEQALSPREFNLLMDQVTNFIDWRKQNARPIS